MTHVMFMLRSIAITVVPNGVLLKPFPPSDTSEIET